MHVMAGRDSGRDPRGIWDDNGIFLNHWGGQFSGGGGSFGLGPAPVSPLIRRRRRDVSSDLARSIPPFSSAATLEYHKAQLEERHILFLLRHSHDCLYMQPVRLPRTRNDGQPT